ncbi:N-acetylmuramoyl-L-alanine amidase family protein, partial [Staphylococcus warneri]
MTKKFNYKLPSMVAVTLLGTAFTAHHADAAETAQDQTKNKNVLDDQATLKQANNANQEVSNPTQNISGTQTYQDPTKVKPVKTTSTENNDASINQQKTENASTNENTNVKAQTTDASNQNNNQIKENSTVTEGQKQEKSNKNLDNNDNQSLQQDSTKENNQDIAQQNAKQENTTETTTQNQSQQQFNATSQNAKQTVKDNGGYRIDDDEDDVDDESNSVDASQKTQSNQQSKENVATNTTKMQSATPKANDLKANNVSNESAKVSSTQSNDNATKENAKQVTTFNSVAKPRMMYATANKATSSLPKYQPQVKSSINDYIRKKNFKAPQIEEDYSSYFPKYGYRNGVGRPEGIVVHDTANDNSTITGEINYMKNNYNSAFVHAFVDGNRIIETAPTDYLSWGAGPNANNRFINVEIVHTHDYDSFARSMNNYADYAATQLQYYGLKPNSAENDGSGTVWTHAAISRWLGGTDHADPHAYFQQHNYSYNELYDLINEKYQIKMGQVAPWGTTTATKPSNGGSTTKPSTGGTTTKPSSNDKLTVAANNGMAQIKPTNNGLYTTVYDKKGHSTNQAQKALSVTKTATLGNNKFYLVQDYNTGEKFGWVKQGDVIYNTAKSPVKVNQSYNVKPGTKAYTVPWGT